MSHNPVQVLLQLMLETPESPKDSLGFELFLSKLPLPTCMHWFLTRLWFYLVSPKVERFKNSRKKNVFRTFKLKSTLIQSYSDLNSKAVLYVDHIPINQQNFDTERIKCKRSRIDNGTTSTKKVEAFDMERTPVMKTQVDQG